MGRDEKKNRERGLRKRRKMQKGCEEVNVRLEKGGIKLRDKTI